MAGQSFTIGQCVCVCTLERRRDRDRERADAARKSFILWVVPPLQPVKKDQEPSKREKHGRNLLPPIISVTASSCDAAAVPYGKEKMNLKEHCSTTVLDNLSVSCCIHVAFISRVLCRRRLHWCSRTKFFNNGALCLEK